MSSDGVEDDFFELPPPTMASMRVLAGSMTFVRTSTARDSVLIASAIFLAPSTIVRKSDRALSVSRFSSVSPTFLMISHNLSANSRASEKNCFIFSLPSGLPSHLLNSSAFLDSVSSMSLPALASPEVKIFPMAPARFETMPHRLFAAVHA